MADSKARLWSLKFRLSRFLVIVCRKFHRRLINKVKLLKDRTTYFERALNQLFVAVLDGDSKIIM